MDHTEANRTLATERYLLGEMSSVERDEYEEHLFGCVDCAEAVKTGAVFVDNARAVFREQAAFPGLERAEPRVRHFAPWWKRYGFPVLAPTFAALLCIAGYQRMVSIPRLRDQLASATAPQPLPSFALHAISRGQQRSIELPANARFLSLYFDVTTESPSGYICEVREAAGSAKLSVRVPEPKPGEAVNLLLGRSQLPAGEYTLIVRTEPPDAREIARFPFKIEYR
jgi:hypothetical protein